jgi:hypothetical protein
MGMDDKVAQFHAGQALLAIPALALVLGYGLV